MRSEQALGFDLSLRVKLRLTGADRLRFLNGQITNDVRKASDSAAVEACILSAKGKLNAHVFISTGPDCFFIDADPELTEALPARLDRYVIADDVQTENITSGLSIFHLLGRNAPTLESSGRVVSARRFVEPGWDVWIEAGSRDSVLQELSASFQIVDPVSEEVFRIQQGIPRWGCELTEEIIPIEANLESRTIDYEKGCYIGQEVISRIKMSGQTNKRLCGLVSLTRLSPKMKLVASAPSDKEVGWITSAACSGGREIALGYVKRGFNDIGTKLDAIAPDARESEHASVEIVSLPFS